MSRPRISRKLHIAGYYIWACIGSSVIGYGSTPEEAFENWLMIVGFY